MSTEPPNRKESILIELRHPFPEERVFRYQAVQEALDILIDQPYAEYSVSELTTLTETSQGAISKAVGLLSEFDMSRVSLSGIAR